MKKKISRRTRRDNQFARIAIGLGIGILLYLIVFLAVAIATSPKDETTFEPDILVIETEPVTSHIVEPKIELEEVEPIPEETEIKEPYIELPEDEKYMLATLIFLEGGGESAECQYGIGSVVINRVTTSGDSLESVIFAEGQFEPAYLISSTTPENTQLEIVNELCINGPSLPEYVTYFRADHFHEWSDITPYRSIDNTYFSYSGDLCYQVMSEAMAEEE